MNNVIIGGLAVIGGVVVLVASLAATYGAIAFGLAFIARGLRRLDKFVFYKFGGVADPETNRYKPPQPPWDRVRYEIIRLRQYNEILMVKIGAMNSVGISMNGLEKLYEERKEYYD